MVDSQPERGSVRVALELLNTPHPRGQCPSSVKVNNKVREELKVVNESNKIKILHRLELEKRKGDGRAGEKNSEEQRRHKDPKEVLMWP